MRVAKEPMEADVSNKAIMFAIVIGVLTVSTAPVAWGADADQALLKALGGAKVTLEQGIAQVAKGTEVPTEAKFELEDGKLMLSVYTSAKGFDTPAEDNSFNEYSGVATEPAWTPKKEVFADVQHVARSAQYHTLLSMTKVTLPALIDKASAQGTVFSVKEKVRSGRPVFEVMTARGDSTRTTYFDLVTGQAMMGM